MHESSQHRGSIGGGSGSSSKKRPSLLFAIENGNQHVAGGGADYTQQQQQQQQQGVAPGSSGAGEMNNGSCTSLCTTSASSSPPTTTSTGRTTSFHRSTSYAELKNDRKQQQQQQSRSRSGRMLVALTLITFATYTNQWIRQHNLDSMWDSVLAQSNAVKSNPITNSNSVSHAWVTESSIPFNASLVHGARHLVIITGHAVTISGHLEDADHDENDWFLYEYQKDRGLPEAIVGHIETGIDIATADPSSLLVITGGQTRPLSGPHTEGSSYFHVADAIGLWPPGSNTRARTVTEDYSTDSFENLMFSICRFREVTGNYPTDISLVSFSFKRKRFETMHAAALRWPAEHFHYYGFDPPASTGFDLEEATLGEQANAAVPYQNDSYGCHSPLLQEKREERNPFRRTPPYDLTCPDMKELLHYCGQTIIPADLVPW